MANYNLLNNLIKEIPTNLKRFLLRRLRRFNAIPRASRIIEKTATDRGERAPLPEKIQKKIDEALQNDPELLKTIASDKNESLLERLKKVFVTSIGYNKDMFNKTRLTPIQYNLFKPDVIEEYKENIPEGKFSLKQASLFLKEFQRNPSMAGVESLSDRFKIAPKQMMCLLTHTKVFKSVEPINKRSKTGLAQTFDTMLPSIIQTEPDEERVYRILDRRSTRFRQFYKEKLDLDQNFTYQVKNLGLKKVFTSLNITKDDQKQIEGAKSPDKVPVPSDKIVSLPEQQTIVVNDLKPGEDPEAWEKIPTTNVYKSDITHLVSGEYRGTENDPFSIPESVRYPEDEKFDVFEVMERQDKETRKAKRKTEKKQTDKEKVPEEEKKSSEKLLDSESQKLQVQGEVSSKNT